MTDLPAGTVFSRPSSLLSWWDSRYVWRMIAKPKQGFTLPFQWFQWLPAPIIPARMKLMYFVTIPLKSFISVGYPALFRLRNRVSLIQLNLPRDLMCLSW